MSNITSAMFTENNESWCEPRAADLNMKIAITNAKMLPTYLFRNIVLSLREKRDVITLSIFRASQSHRFSAFVPVQLEMEKAFSQ